MANKAVEFLKGLIKRKISKNVLEPSTVGGTLAVAGACTVDLHSLIEVLPEQYALVLRIIIAVMGLYAIYTEEKPE